jgi:hypothetical protein
MLTYVNRAEKPRKERTLKKTPFEQMLIEQCSPTLAGIKPASLFRFSGEELSAVRETVHSWDDCLRPLGIRVRILKECHRTGAAVVYLYREAWLKEIVQETETHRFLERCGYRDFEISAMLALLSDRLCLEQEFPHEIGILLGYPLKDVVGFIENKGKNFTYCGLWKCYGDPRAAQTCFDRCRACTADYRRRYAHGTPVIQLVVAA